MPPEAVMRANSTTQNYAEFAPSGAALSEILKALIGRVMRAGGAPPATAGGALNEAVMAEVTAGQATAPSRGADARRRKQVPEGLAHIQTTPAPCVQSLEPTR